MTVVVKGLSKSFGARNEVAAVDGVSFEAPAHGITSLLGPSGSGKSTVLRLIAGLEVPDAGAVSIEGRDVTAVPVRDRGIGFVFQNYALFRHMTVFDNVAFGLSVRGAPKAETRERVEELLTLVQLADYAQRVPDQLSGGQRQRIALARALAPRPRVLLLDEPFGALDTQVRGELRGWLHTFHEKTQVTTLLVTHDQEEALELSEHVVVLRDGRIEQAGAPDDLYENPASAFVASFLGGATRLDVRSRTGRSGPADPSSYEPGRGLTGYVRPHDVDVRKASEDDPGAPDTGSTARVERLVRVGGHVKLVVAFAGGDTISVQMPKHEFDRQAITLGDRVIVDLRDVKVFAQDYAI